MALSTIGSIANFLQTSFGNIPEGLSGANLIAVVDMNRQHVANFTNTDIGSNSISAEFQPPIVSLSKADAIDFVSSQNVDDLQLGDLSIKGSTGQGTSGFWRQMAESQLNEIGRSSQFAKSLS